MNDITNNLPHDMASMFATKPLHSGMRKPVVGPPDPKMTKPIPGDIIKTDSTMVEGISK